MAVFRSWITAEGDLTHVLDFLNIQGIPTPTRQQFDRVSRPGVDGIGLWYTGERGEPFQIITVSDYASEANANSAFTAARAMVGGKRDLYWQNGLWGTVLIHAVSMQPKKYVKSAVGGQAISAGGSGFLLTLNWTMETLV
ncbi:MAG: hypothetical protein JNL58_04525 [Planctomyces sp.]|nr:hypothetical protein [Planctomyces sp.]